MICLFVFRFVLFLIHFFHDVFGINIMSKYVKVLIVLNILINRIVLMIYYKQYNIVEVDYYKIDYKY